MEGCKDCVYIESIKTQLSDVVSKNNCLEERVTQLERTSDVNITKIDSIFETLKAIQTGIEKITNKMDEIEKRPSKFIYGVIATVTGSVVGAFIISNILKIKK